MLLELNCETDFVARTDDFQQLARELAMQVAGLSPLYVGRDDIPADVLEEQQRRFAEEASARAARPIASRRSSRASSTSGSESVCLLEMPYRDTDRKVADLITEKVALLGENIRVARFARMAVGESTDGHGDEGGRLGDRSAAARTSLSPGAAEAVRRGADGRRASTGSIRRWRATSPRR